MLPMVASKAVGRGAAEEGGDVGERVECALGRRARDARHRAQPAKDVVALAAEGLDGVVVVEEEGGELWQRAQRHAHIFVCLTLTGLVQ